jgi:hypothetical protein
MGLLARFSKGLLGAGLVTGALLSMGGCGNYALYKVDVTSIESSNRGDIAQCRMTITDEGGKTVLDHYLLQAQHDSLGNLVQGCEGTKTKAAIGTFSYSSSRSSGSLKFTVEAYDANGPDPNDPAKNRLQWGESGDIPVKVFSHDGDDIPVSVAIKKQ